MKTRHSRLVLLTIAGALGICLTLPDVMAFEQTLRSFTGTVYTEGSNPSAQLIELDDGFLYGTTATGGSNQAGTVFRIKGDGSRYTVVYEFGSSAGDNPSSSFIRGPDGALYGTTIQGGNTGYGTIFKLRPDGTGFTVLHDFESGDNAPWTYTSSSLAVGRDGILYGTACNGWQVTTNVIFRLSPDGSDFAVLGQIEAPLGLQVQPALLPGMDGEFYGVTQNGGSHRLGTIFKMNTNGTGYAVLHEFAGSPDDGEYPQASLIEGADGKLYGTTGGGGKKDLGTLFRIDRDGSNYQVLHHLNIPSLHGAASQGELTRGLDDKLYGVIFGGGGAAGAVFRFDPGSAAFETLYQFDTRPNDGACPAAPVPTIRCCTTSLQVPRTANLPRARC